MSATATTTRVEPQREGARGSVMHLAWLDTVKGLAMLWIVLSHVVELIFGFVHMGNPDEHWVPLADRIGQLRPLSGFGALNWPVNVLRWLGWAGDQGVALFLIASGFGLTWSMLAPRPRRFDPRDFYARRLSRLLPLWAVVHVVFLLLAVAGLGPLVIGPRFLLSLLGFRATTSMLYYGAPAWWFVGLLLQLYLVFPLLWLALRRFGPARLLVVTAGVAIAVRGVGLVTLGRVHLPVGIDAWSRGALFPTRLPELVFGVALAAWYFEHPERVQHALRSRVAIASAVLVYVVGTALSFGLVGMAAAPFLLGTSTFFLLWSCFRRFGAGNRALSWTGRHSYSIFLVHHPVLLMLVPAGRGHGLSGVARLVVGLGVTVVLALALEQVAARLIRFGSVVRQRAGAVGLAASGVTAILLLWSPLVVADALVRAHDPQEADGWGERSSLRPDDRFGWTLRPSTTTRLRWNDYDYVVSANSLGFPGPEYPTARTPGVDRVLVVGDAYTSAEGVGTDDAWPRLLESVLPEATGRDVEVLSFAITGYGPNQYRAVLQRFVPELRPDVVVVAMSFTDFDDALKTDDQFRAEAGFTRPEPDSLRSHLELSQLRAWIDVRLKERVRAAVLHEPEASGWWFGGFGALERAHLDLMREGAGILTDRLREMTEAASSADAPLVTFMVPPPATVCERSDLPYFPDHVDLGDRARFDPDQVGRLAQGAVDDAGVTRYEDLHDVLAAAPACPYQPRNLHWTEEGHRVVAEHVARKLAPVLDAHQQRRTPAGRDPDDHRPG